MDPRGLPEFIIIGAQKCGTSSLHALLDHHPGLFLPRGEIFFFDVDDVEQHPDFFVQTRQGWTRHDWEADLSTYLRWYRGFFGAAAPGQMLGEDSTTYLASRLAPARIRALLPEARLVVLLRDPVRRAYSAYWHNVAAGRVCSSFERELRDHGPGLLDKGRYDEQLDRYLAHFPREQVQVLLFDDFVAEPQRTVDHVCRFLGVEPVSISGVETHRNAARPPLWVPARLAANRLLGRFLRKSYSRAIPNMPGYRPGSLYLRAKGSPWADRLDEAVTSLWPRKRYPPMRSGTRAFLQHVYWPHVAHLSEQLGRDLLTLWGYPERVD